MDCGEEIEKRKKLTKRNKGKLKIRGRRKDGKVAIQKGK